MKYIILILFLTGCSFSIPDRDSKLIGSVSYYYDIQCLKTDSHFSPGLNMNGDFHVTSVTTCIRSECFKFKKTLGRNFLQDKIERLDIVDVKNCIK